MSDLGDLIQQSFTVESAAAAITGNDLGLLRSTGRFDVTLSDPGDRGWFDYAVVGPATVAADQEPLPRTTTAACEVHKTHQPASHVNEVHHVWPLGDGGPNVPENKVVVCATGHNSIHDLLNKWRKGTPAKATLAGYSRTERDLAKLGWDRIQRGVL